MDYSKLTLEELLIKEKNIKRQETISRFLIGFSVGVMIYGVAKNGLGFIYIVIPLILIYGVYKNSKNLKQNLEQIQAEINAKNTK